MKTFLLTSLGRSISQSSLSYKIQTSSFTYHIPHIKQALMNIFLDMLVMDKQHYLSRDTTYVRKAADTKTWKKIPIKMVHSRYF